MGAGEVAQDLVSCSFALQSAVRRPASGQARSNVCVGALVCGLDLCGCHTADECSPSCGRAAGHQTSLQVIQISPPKI